MPRHIALGLALQRMAGVPGAPGRERPAGGDPSPRLPKPGPRARVRVAVAALRGDMELFKSLTTQPPSSRIGS